MAEVTEGHSDAPPSPNPEEEATPLTGEELLVAVRKQVEYYFSRANLASDAFLVSQMDAQMFVPLDVIAGFNGVQKLTKEIPVLLEAASTSEHLVLDQSGPFPKLRPNVTSERSTLILRDIPQATPEADVKLLFGEYAAEIRTIKSEIGDNWYVHFNGEAPALSAFEHLQSQTFNGASIRARIKSESFIRSFYAQQGDQGGALAAPQTRYGGYKGGGKGGYGKGGYYPQQAPMNPNAGMYYTADIDPNMQAMQAGMQAMQGRGGGRGYGKGGRGKGGYPMQQGMGYPVPYPGQQMAMQGGKVVPVMGQPPSLTTAKKSKKKKGKQDGVAAASKPQVQAPVFDAEAFPALSPGAADKKVGYAKPYKAYAPEEIATIVSKLGAEGDGVVPAPDCIPNDSVCKAESANVEFDSFAAVVKATSPEITTGGA